MTKECELCNCPARMYCESDKASLCWDCDEKVHSANFLVARHSRSLLCHVCQSITNWSASGLKLGHTLSVCHDCPLITNDENPKTNNCCESETRHRRRDDVDEDVSDRDSDEEYEGEDEVVEDDGENQVVPLTSTPPPPVSRSSSSSRSGLGGATTMKRRRGDADFDSDFDDEIGSRSSNYNNTISTALTLRQPGQIESTASFTAAASVRQMKVTRTSEQPTVEVDLNGVGAKNKQASPWAIIKSLKRYGQSIISENGNVALAGIVGMQKLSRDPRVTSLD